MVGNGGGGGRGVVYLSPEWTTCSAGPRVQQSHAPTNFMVLCLTAPTHFTICKGIVNKPISHDFY